MKGFFIYYNKLLYTVLFKAICKASVIFEENSIFIFGGWSGLSQLPIQRLDIGENDMIVNVELIGTQTYEKNFPIVFTSEINTCTIS